MKIRQLTACLALVPLVTGCATMLRGPDKAPDIPAFAEPLGGLMDRSKASAPADEALRAGLQAKAAAMLATRAPAKPGPMQPVVTPSASAAAPLAVAERGTAAPAAMPSSPGASKPAGAAEAARTDAVAAMLSRARQAPAQTGAPVPPKPPAANAAPAAAMLPPASPTMNAGQGTLPNMPAMPLAKIETRLADPPPSRQAAATIRFPAGNDALDAEGNRALAELARRTGLEAGTKLVVTAGLAGNAPAWERMQLAGRRLETVARHVPPPLTVERRFDPALDGNIVQVTIAGGGS